MKEQNEKAAPTGTVKGRDRGTKSRKDKTEGTIDQAPGDIIRPGISQEMLVKAGVRPVGATEAKALTGTAASGLAIPYKGTNGRDILDKENPFVVLRLDKPTQGRKYSQLLGSTTHIYIPPRLDIKSAERMVIVEGEFKAMALWQRGIPAVGIKGFSGCGSPGKPGELHAELRALLECGENLQAIEFLGDTDTVINKEFGGAAAALVAGLAKLERDFDITLPILPGAGPKGIDDCFEAWGKGSLNKWEGLERIKLDSETHPNTPGGKSQIRFELLETLNAAALKNVIEGGGKPEQKLLATVGELKAAPRLQGKVMERIVKLNIPGLGKQGLKDAIKNTSGDWVGAEENSELREKLEEVSKSIYKWGGEYIAPRLEIDKTSASKFVKKSREDLQTRLTKIYGLSPERRDGLSGVSQTAWVLEEITSNNELHYMGTVAGYPEGLHEWSGHKILVDQPRLFLEGKSGECPTTIEYIARLVGKNAGERVDS